MTPGAYWRSSKSAPLAKRILVACSRGAVMIAMRAEYFGWMRDSDGSNIFDVVTHWMPIPDPPIAETAPTDEQLEGAHKKWVAEQKVNIGAKP